MSDIIVIGAGIAGMTAAIKASELGANVSLISPDYSERSQSVMAMGGINAALGKNDSVDEHFTDTMNGGCEINDVNAVKRLTGDAPKIIDWLSKIGTTFSRDSEGNINQRYFGGQKKKRTAYAGARTGKQIVTALITECRKMEAEGNVTRFIGWRFLSLIVKDGKCLGAICINETTSEIREFLSDSVIMATGGLNKLFGRTSGSIHNDGVATARLFMQGVELANLEMIQYHPTTVKTPVKRMLITEAARGEGGNLYVLRDGVKWYFMKEWYPELAELMPRDVVSRSIYKASDGGKNQVYLDISHLDDETVKTKLDEVYEICTNYLNLDPTSEAIPVYPGVHFFMGGIRTDENHKTNIQGLYAAGECSVQYHGANRLGGNSLLGAVHGGWIAAENAINDSNDDYINRIDDEIESFNKFEKNGNSEDVDGKLAEIMAHSMGIYRNEDGLNDALEKLDKLNVNANSYYDYIKQESLILLAKASVVSALMRKESRGAHQRIDYPDTSDEYKRTTCVTYDGEINVDFR